MLDYNRALLAYKSIQSSSLEKLRLDIYKSAIRYSTYRTDWQFMEIEQRLEQDQERSAAHNRFMDTCNIFARNQRNLNEDTAWAEILKQERKTIGDLACYINAFIGIHNR